jgi:hypothetical protein
VTYLLSIVGGLGLGAVSILADHVRSSRRRRQPAVRVEKYGTPYIVTRGYTGAERRQARGSREPLFEERVR